MTSRTCTTQWQSSTTNIPHQSSLSTLQLYLPSLLFYFAATNVISSYRICETSKLASVIWFARLLTIRNPFSNVIIFFFDIPPDLFNSVATVIYFANVGWWWWWSRQIEVSEVNWVRLYYLMYDRNSLISQALGSTRGSDINACTMSGKLFLYMKRLLPPRFQVASGQLIYFWLMDKEHKSLKQQYFNLLDTEGTADRTTVCLRIHWWRSPHLSVFTYQGSSLCTAEPKGK